MFACNYSSYVMVVSLRLARPFLVLLPGNTVARSVLFTIVVQFVPSNMAILRLAVIQEILFVENGTVGTLVPLLASSVSAFIRLAGLFRCESVVDLLSTSQSYVLL